MKHRIQQTLSKKSPAPEPVTADAPGLQLPEYRPVSFHARGHGHTIILSMLGRKKRPPHRRVRIDTPDGDFLDLDVSEPREPRALAILIHGLEGSSDRYYIAGLSRKLFKEGYVTVAMNFRGCSGEMNRMRRFYHSGETGDLQTVMDWTQEQWPGLPRYAAGFSLGANVLLKSLGELSANHPLKAAAAISAPFDLKEGSLAIGKGFNKVYEKYFLLTLKQKLEQKRKVYPDLPRFDGRTLYEFDDQVTAPVHGFRDADDYYATSSCGPYVSRIRKPALVIHSRLDPLCPFEMVPKQDIRQNPMLNAVFTNDGGHVGFASRPAGWLNRAVAAYFRQVGQRPPTR